MNGCSAKRGCFVMWKMMSRALSALTIFIWNKWGWKCSTKSHEFWSLAEFNVICDEFAGFCLWFICKTYKTKDR